MEPDDLLKAITNSSSLRDVVEVNILSGVPWIFQGDTVLFTAWRTAVAKEVGVAPEGIYLVGSAATGYSLNPTKAGENFRQSPSGASHQPSDLDIAIVAPNFFEQAWNSIIRFDRGGALGRFLREQYGYNERRFPTYIHEYADAVTRAATDVARRTTRSNILLDRIEAARQK